MSINPTNSGVATAGILDIIAKMHSFLYWPPGNPVTAKNYTVLQTKDLLFQEK